MKRLLILFSFVGIISGCILEKEHKSSDIQTGDPLPAFKVVMNDGTVITDDDLKKGVSIVMFFHTSCPDCQQALPRVQAIYDEYAPKGLGFALISREESSSDIDDYWKNNSLNMPYSAQSDRKVYNKFASSRIPRIYISDENGIVRYIFTDDPVPSYDELKSAVESLIR